MKTVALAVLVSLTVAHGFNAQGPEPVRPGRIRGQVVDTRTGVPLRRARVIVSAAQRPVDTVFTDDEGRFAIENLPAKPLILRVSKAGYAVSLVTLSADTPQSVLMFAMAKSATCLSIKCRKATDCACAPARKCR